MRLTPPSPVAGTLSMSKAVSINRREAPRQRFEQNFPRSRNSPRQKPLAISSTSALEELARILQMWFTPPRIGALTPRSGRTIFFPGKLKLPPGAREELFNGPSQACRVRGGRSGKDQRGGRTPGLPSQPRRGACGGREPRPEEGAAPGPQVRRA